MDEIDVDGTFQDEVRGQTLDTPDINSSNSNPFTFDNYLDVLPPISSTPEQLSEDSGEIPFDQAEWQITDTHSGRKRPPRQYEFLELLLKNSRYSSYVRWLDEEQGLLQILLPNEVATLWGKVKSRQTNGTMTYQTFSRGLRCYYTSGLMIKTKKKHIFHFNRAFNNPSS